MTTVIYNYFSENYGFVDINNNVFESKYKSASAKDLKKVLKKLKSDNGNLMAIKFVAKKLRNRLRRADTDQQHADINASDEIDHNELINKNFWGYVKNIFTKKSDSLPTFDLAQCTDYFTRTFSAVIPNKIFNIPSWIPKFSSPTTPFNLDL